MEDIKKQELKILQGCDYLIQIPTSLCFLRAYLKDVLGINSLCKYAFKAIPKEALCNPEEANKQTLEKLSVYFAKMTMYDLQIQNSGKTPSLQAAGALYVALKALE